MSQAHIGVINGIFIFWEAFMRILGMVKVNVSPAIIFCLEACLWFQMEDICYWLFLGNIQSPSFICLVNVHNVN